MRKNGLRKRQGEEGSDKQNSKVNFQTQEIITYRRHRML